MKDYVVAGWMVFVRLQISRGVPCNMPATVREELRRRKLLKVTPVDKDDPNQGFITSMTRRGVALTDLEGPEWGVNSIPQAQEAEG